jgi:hypothetical protein
MIQLSLETYAKLLARLACRRHARLDAVLAEIGVQAEALLRDEPALLRELATTLQRHKGVAAMKFAEALATEVERLGGAALALGAPGDAAPLVPARPEVPSFLRAEQAPMAAALAVSAVPLPAPPLALAETHKLGSRELAAAVERGRLPFVQRDPSSVGGADAQDEVRPTVELPLAPHVGEAGLLERAMAPRDLSGTADPDTQAIMAAVLRGALPFGRPDQSREDADVAALPLETYASVTRALARGEPREEALKKHGLGAEAFDKLARAWAPRLQRNPHLMERFKELVKG